MSRFAIVLAGRFEGCRAERQRRQSSKLFTARSFEGADWQRPAPVD